MFSKCCFSAEWRLQAVITAISQMTFSCNTRFSGALQLIIVDYNRDNKGHFRQIYA